MTLFGMSAILDQKQVDLVVHLENWTPGREIYDRLGGYIGILNCWVLRTKSASSEDWS